VPPSDLGVKRQKAVVELPKKRHNLVLVKKMCWRCHEKAAAKPKDFPQVITAEHSGGVACNSCHQPHNPHL